jgi:hypothetical protein
MNTTLIIGLLIPLLGLDGRHEQEGDGEDKAFIRHVV